MTISIKLPEAADAFDDEVNNQNDTRHDQCWDVVGASLNRLVREVVPAYYEKLELGDEDIAKNKRGEILDLHWGRIEQDAAALVGLGKALGNLSATVDANVKEVAKQWSGDSFTAFRTAMDKIRATLDAYAAGAEKVGGVMLEAMAQARTMYADYAEASRQTLTFEHLTPPGDWHKMDDRTGEFFESECPYPLGCEKNHEEAGPKLRDRFATTRRMQVTQFDPCYDNLERVLTMYDNLVEDGEEERDKIRRTVRDWCAATDDFKDQITELFEVAVGNVYELSRSQVFSGLRVIGGAAGGGGETARPGDDGGYPDDGGGGVMAPIVEPTTAPDPEAAVTEPAPAEPSSADSEAAEPEPGTVTINDGARTIGVREADDGHVIVAVTDADGATKTYDLDFDAASGLPRDAGARQEGVEQVPASTNGKCVIQNGAVTITAERPLFAPDQIALTVDDGSGTPATHTVDFPDLPAQSAESPATGTDGPTDSANTPDEPADKRTAPTGRLGEPTTSTGDPAGARAGTGDPVGGLVESAGGSAASAAASAGLAEVPEASVGAGTGDPVGGPVESAAASTPATAGPVGVPGAGGGSVDPSQAGPVAPVQSDQLTSPQSWTGDARGSVSGILVPEQQDGEAGLASAPDDSTPQREHDATGMVGAGLPMMGGAPGANGGDTGGRAGSGWSVHGDLFDSGEPVYSMHGVLGADDAERDGRP